MADVTRVNCLLVMVFFFHTGFSKSNISLEVADELRLLRRLMRNYERSVRPVINASSTVVVSVGITLTQILDIDERNQVMTTNVWLDQSWEDVKMKWNPADYGGIRMLRVPCDLLWLPDIVLYNSVDDYTKGYMKSLAMVMHDGTIFWPPIVRMRSSCKMDVTYFPFDDQICHLKLGSWAYDGYQVDVTNRSGNVDLSNFVDNGEWELVDARSIRTVFYYTCCPEPFPDVRFYLHIRRRTIYYTFNIIIPCVILSLLTIAGFILPAASGEKVTLGLTTLLAFSVFMLLIAESMPATSEFVPLIGIYLIVIMAMQAFSVIFCVFVLNIHYRGAHNRRAPLWLRRFATRVIGRALCIKSRYINDSLLDEINIDLDPFVYDAGYGTFNRGFKLNSNSNVHAPASHESSKNSSPHVRMSKTNGRTSRQTDIRRTEEEVIQHLRLILNKQTRHDMEAVVVREWEDIASILDRFLFWFFFIVAFLATLSMLVFSPMVKDVKFDTDT